MTRTRLNRYVAIAVAFAFVLTLVGLPVTAGAVPSRTVRGPGARVARTVVKGRGAHAAKSSLGAAIVSDDNIPGIPMTLPINGQAGSLDAVTDYDDVYQVWVNAGDTLVARLNVTSADPYDPALYIYGPGAADVNEDLPIAYGTQRLGAPATVSGYYYIDVYSYSWTGAYALDAQAIPPSPTSITIKTTATTARIGNIPILSGAVTPFGMVGKNMVAYVMKPGKTYWTYSSNRTVYNLGGKAAWQYKYYFKPGMVKGVYKFKAVVPAWPGFLTSTSPTTVSIRLR